PPLRRREQPAEDPFASPCRPQPQPGRDSTAQGEQRKALGYTAETRPAPTGRDSRITDARPSFDVRRWTFDVLEALLTARIAAESPTRWGLAPGRPARTSNIERRTSNVERPTSNRSCIRRSKLDVRCSMFCNLAAGATGKK